jgi:hypothetical protein
MVPAVGQFIYNLRPGPQPDVVFPPLAIIKASCPSNGRWLQVGGHIKNDPGRTSMTTNFTRRGVLKTGAVAGAGVALPTIFTSRANAYTNEPTGDTVTLGFNVPQTGPYADEGADELRAYELAVEHLNGTGRRRHA